MEVALETMGWPTNSDAELSRMNDALVQQAEALQDVARAFSQTVGKEGTPARVSPLMEQAMVHSKVCSLGSLHLLAAQAEVLQQQDKPAFVNVTTAFLQDCDWHQVVVAPKHLGSLCHKFAQACISDEQAIRALLPLRTAAYSMGSATSSLTPIHPEFLQCCIMTRFYSLGARFLDDRPVFGVHPKATGLTPVHFLRHFYYGGVIYAGVKRWKDALDSFLMLITAPANVLSALVVEGYKKMILVSLILSGKSPTLPKYASNVVTRQLKNHTSEYDSLATLCQAEDIKGLHAAVVEGSDTFTQDCNMGLVKQVVSALTTRKIMQLTYTYITLSLKDISNTVGLEDNDNVEGQILRMVEAGDICAKIESPAGTVLFLEDMELSSSAAMTMRLGSDLQSTAELTERVRKLEARLLTNSIYVQKMSGDHSLQGSGLGGPPSYTAWEDIGMGD